MKKIVLALAAVGALATGNAFAQAYVGAAVGASRFDIDCSGLTRCDKSDTGWKLYGGYKFMPNVAGELVYMDFGKAKFGGPAIVNGTIVDVDAEAKGTSAGVGVALMGDFAPQWSGVARLGVARNKAEIDGSALGVNVSLGSDSTTQVYAGLGVSYAINQRLKVDAGFDFTRFEFQGEKENAQMFTIGVSYGF